MTRLNSTVSTEIVEEAPAHYYRAGVEDKILPTDPVGEEQCILMQKKKRKVLRALSTVSTGEGYYFFTVIISRRKSEFYPQMHGKWALITTERSNGKGRN